MKTVKTYMVRKPSDLDEVKSITRANSDRLETVAVVETPACRLQLLKRQRRLL